jgi:hypothetical protein
MVRVSQAKGYFKCLTVQPKIRSSLQFVVAQQRLWRAASLRRRVGPGLSDRLMLTRGISERCDANAILLAVKQFDNFNEANDPHHEHDFGAIEVGGDTVFFKIDYYARDLEHGSPDAADPDVTTRVLTVMLAEEY